MTQTNTASSDATAGNLNVNEADADQKQAGDLQVRERRRAADRPVRRQRPEGRGGSAATFQVKPSNTNTSIRVLSKGDDGDVSQTNEATSNATAGNLNVTKQDADQKQAGDACKCRATASS